MFNLQGYTANGTDELLVTGSSSQARIQRIRAASPPVTGTFDLLYGDRTIAGSKYYRNCPREAESTVVS